MTKDLDVINSVVQLQDIVSFYGTQLLYKVGEITGFILNPLTGSVFLMALRDVTKELQTNLIGRHRTFYLAY